VEDKTKQVDRRRKTTPGLDPQAVADFVVKRRQELGLTVADLHRSAGISRTELLHIEEGRRCNSSHWAELEIALQVEPYALRAILDPKGTRLAFFHILRTEFSEEISDLFKNALTDPALKEQLIKRLSDPVS
jgi:DNA-binding XRE family transcriptional regulator